MISAYFDDSGTHDKSEIVVVAGVFGTEARLRGLESAWKKELASPIQGRKPPLKRFHMTECHNSTGEYAGWSRAETDFHCYLLRQHIVDADVSGYGVACSRKDWDELVTGDLRDILGTPEGFCIRNCFVRTLYWSEKNYFDPVLHFVFDTRPSAVRRDASTVYDAYSKITDSKKLDGIVFENSFDAVLLQAADLFAWELYQHAKDVLSEGPIPIRRAGFRELAKAIKFDGQIAPRESIEEMWDKVWKYKDPDMLKQVAKHFRMFDPENPDYSYLSVGDAM